MEEKEKKSLCFNCGKHWPHQGEDGKNFKIKARCDWTWTCELENQTIPRRLIQHPTIDDVVNERGRFDCVFPLGRVERISPGLSWRRAHGTLQLFRHTLAYTVEEAYLLDRGQRLKYPKGPSESIWRRTWMGCSTISKDIIVHRRVIKEYVRNLDALLRKSPGKNVVFKTAKMQIQ